jgi:hypothetical protein
MHHRPLIRHIACSIGILNLILSDRVLNLHIEQRRTSRTAFVSIRAEMCCLQAAQMTSSGPNKPNMLHFRYRQAYWNWCSSCLGKSRWTADHTQRLSVRRHEKSIDKVPLPSGCWTKPTSVVFVASALEICMDILESVDNECIYGASLVNGKGVMNVIWPNN